MSGRRNWRISRQLANAGGGDDVDAPPVTLGPVKPREIMRKIRVPLPTAKTDTAIGLVLIGQEIVERYKP